MRFSDLKRDQKEAIGLLQIGTFLEYFDLMIYVHMAVILNELFFPPTDPKTAAVLTAFAFCSTYLLRPFGALIFGYIGDNWGRRPTVIMTTTIMACCCVLMANLPTYAEIGIMAGIIVSVLRIMQGMSSMGEIMGAFIYVTEITRPPVQYSACVSISIASALGTILALGVASLASTAGFNWRLAFWLGAIIAVVGMVARTKLRETPEYADAKIKMKRALERAREGGLEGPAQLLKSLNKIPKEKTQKGNFFYYFISFCVWPFIFYMTYVYFIPTLKSECGYSNQDVLLHNFFLSIIQLIVMVVHSHLSYKVYPIFTAKVSAFAFALLMLSFPIIVSSGVNYQLIFFFQALTLILQFPKACDPIMIKNFPVFKRFTSVTFGYACARAMMYVIISFGLVYLTEWIGFYGIWVVAFPLIVSCYMALLHFENLEKKHGEFPQAYPFNETKQQLKERLSV
jgi:MFS transporter, MHS family, proline/betaine transporter